MNIHLGCANVRFPALRFLAVASALVLSTMASSADQPLSIDTSSMPGFTRSSDIPDLGKEAMVIIPESQPAFGSTGARELQGIEPIVVALDQPALGAKGARELQALMIALIQPADGARGARELQLSDGFSVAELAAQRH